MTHKQSKVDASFGSSFTEELEPESPQIWPDPKDMIPVTSGRTDDANAYNHNYLDNILAEMRIIDAVKPDLATELFDKKYAPPINLATVSHLNKVLPDKRRKPIREKVQVAKNQSLSNWIGMESNHDYAGIVKNSGDTVRIVKPFTEHEDIINELRLAQDLGAIAVGIDVDHVPGEDGKYDVVDGVNLGPISFSDLRRYTHTTNLPFVAKGVLSVQDVLKAKDTGASAIVVFHHHGRLPLDVPSLKMLPATKEALADNGMTIFVDGPLMTGYDVYKAMAMGTNGVLVGRAILSELLKSGQEATEAKIRLLSEQLPQMMFYTGIPDTKSFDSSVLHF